MAAAGIEASCTEIGAKTTEGSITARPNVSKDNSSIAAAPLGSEEASTNPQNSGKETRHHQSPIDAAGGVGQEGRVAKEGHGTIHNC